MIKIALGIIATNEELPLSKFLPELSKAFNGEVIGIDYGSIDKTPELFKQYCKFTITETWPRDFSIAKNRLIQLAKDSGYDWLFILDADETLDSEKVPLLFQYAENDAYELYYLPRVSYVETGVIEANTRTFPDLQSRLFKLNSNFSYYFHVHTQLVKDGVNVYESNVGAVIPNIFIYHHANLKGPKSVLLKVVERTGMEQGWPAITGIETEAKDWPKPSRPLKLL